MYNLQMCRMDFFLGVAAILHDIPPTLVKPALCGSAAEERAVGRQADQE